MKQISDSDPADARDPEPRRGQGLSVHAAWPPVTRVSRRALAIAAMVGVALGIVVLVLSAGDRDSQKRLTVQEENAIRPTGPIESLRDLPRDYAFDLHSVAPAPGTRDPAPSVDPGTRPSGPSAQEQALTEQLRQLADLRRKMLETQRKEQEQAMDSPLLFGGASSPATAPAVASSHCPTTLPTIVFAGRPDGSVGSLGVDPSGDSSPSGGSIAGRAGNQQAFLTAAAAIEPYLSKPLVPPLSRYELKAGSVIPAALVTSINTDLPGDVIGQVTENVYDSATGNYLLIPQGSRLLGKYQSLVSNGQNRALLAWQRLIYPNG